MIADMIWSSAFEWSGNNVSKGPKIGFDRQQFVIRDEFEFAALENWSFGPTKFRAD